MRLVCSSAACLWLALGACDACAEDVTTRVGVCNLLSDPAIWNGKLVEVRGQIIASNDYWIRGTECPDRIRAKGTVFIAGFVFADPQNKKLTAHNVDFHWDLSTLGQLDSALTTAEKTKRHVWATIVGMFETRLPLTDLIDEKAPYKFRGFGHMGSAPGQILIKYLKDISIEDQK